MSRDALIFTGLLAVIAAVAFGVGLALGSLL
jgi:hypothetical protein